MAAMRRENAGRIPAPPPAHWRFAMPPNKNLSSPAIRFTHRFRFISWPTFSEPFLVHLAMKTAPRLLLCASFAIVSAFAAEQVVQLEEMKVTAQKRVQSISDVPVPI